MSLDWDSTTFQGLSMSPRRGRFGVERVFREVSRD